MDRLEKGDQSTCRQQLIRLAAILIMLPQLWGEGLKPPPTQWKRPLHVLAQSSVADLGVQGALQRRLLVLVEDVGARSVLQEHLDDALVAPARRHVQRRVAFVVHQVQTARLDIVVHQGLHTLTHSIYYL